MENWQDWQKPYQHGMMVIWPPAVVRKTVNGQRENYDPLSASYCEAHISLTQPLTNQLDEASWQRLCEVVRGFDAFRIAYGPLNSFLPYPCIWYEIEPREKVLAVREVLHETGLFNLAIKHPENFIPHMTVTEGLSGGAVDEVLLGKLQSESSSGSFLCEELALIVPDEDFRLQVAWMLPLKG